MLLDYLLKIQNIIINININKHDNLLSIHNPIIIESIVNANDKIIHILKSTKQKHSIRAYLNKKTRYQIGFGKPLNDDSLNELHESVDNLQKEIINSDSIKANNNQLGVDKFEEIAYTSIALIKFLGEMAIIYKSNNLEKIQKQIVDMNEALLKYL